MIKFASDQYYPSDCGYWWQPYADPVTSRALSREIRVHPRMVKLREWDNEVEVSADYKDRAPGLFQTRTAFQFLLNNCIIWLGLPQGQPPVTVQAEEETNAMGCSGVNPQMLGGPKSTLFRRESAYPYFAASPNCEELFQNPYEVKPPSVCSQR